MSLRTLFGQHASILGDANYQVLLYATVLPIMGTAMLSPVLDSLVRPFGVSATSIGLLISAYTLPQVFFIPPMGALADRYRRKPVLVGSLLVFGFAGLAVAATPDFEVALALRFCQGVGAAGLNPIIITLIGDLYSGDREATGQGLRFAASGASGTVLPVVAGLVVALGWRFPFLLYALAIPAAMAVQFLLDEPTPKNAGPDADGTRVYIADLVELLRHPRVAAMVVARGLPSVVWFGFLTYNSIVIVRLLGSSPAVAGLMTSLGSLAFAVPATQAGRITERFDSRFFPLVAANVLLALGFAVFVLIPSLGGALVGVVLLGVGEGVTMSLYRSIISTLPPRSLRGGLVSLAESVGWITSTLTPIGMGAAIAVATPLLGFGPAVKITVVATGVIAGLGGIGCLTIAHLSEPVPADRGSA